MFLRRRDSLWKQLVLMKRDQPKIWTNQKQNFFHIAYYSDNFNSQDCAPQAVKQNSKLLDFGCNQHESAEESSIFLAFIAWLCPKAIKNQWLAISPLLRHHRTYFHFLIVLKTLASEISLSSGKPGVGFHRTWQHLSLALLLFNHTLPWDFWIRHTSSFVVCLWWKNLWAIQLFYTVRFANSTSPWVLRGWINACRDK